MQQCPECDRVYDESEYSKCPYCSGELATSEGAIKYKDCPNCDSYMTWDGYCWNCVNCGFEVESDEDDYDGIMET